MEPDENSKRTRVEPVFRWLRDHGGADWPAHLLGLVKDFRTRPPEPGRALDVTYETERKAGPSARRLAWMIENVDRLAPSDGRRWREYQRRVTDNPRREEGLEKLRAGVTRGVDPLLKLEGRTSADCLIECENLVIWIEGKRNDWLAYSTTWDVTRDQLARNAEAAWLLAAETQRDAAIVVCQEHPLKHHEQALLEGYRTGRWAGGWPHLDASERHRLSGSIGTLTWAEIKRAWPAMPLPA